MVPTDLTKLSTSAETFVNRKEELENLKAHMQKALEGMGRLVLLKGEAGSGKSCLAEIFSKECEKEGFKILKGRCLYYESTDPYIPFLEALGDYIDSGESKEEEQENLSVSSISMSLVGAKTGDEGGEISVSDRRELMFDDVINAITRISREQPILFYLDDLQWIDEASSLLLHQIAMNIPDERVLILGAYRHEELKISSNKFPLEKVLKRMKEGKQLYEIDVNRLTFQSTSNMVKKLLKSEDLPQSFLLMVYRETEGNPYYVVEMLTSMIGEGVIDPYSYTWDPERDLADISVPKSIKDITSRRISQLSRTEKKVLMYASILGTEFDFELLENAIEMDVIELLDIIEYLESQGLIHEKEGSGEREIYRFNHIQLRAALYDNMGSSRRRVLHQRVGETIEDVYVDDLDEHFYTLSRHFHEGKNYEKAYEYSIKASEKALESFAIESALDYLVNRASNSLKKAKDIEDPDKEEIELLNNIGELAYDTSKWQTSIDAYEKLLRKVSELGDKKLEGETLRKIGHLYREIQKYGKSMDAFERSLEIATELEDNEGSADSNRGLGYIHWREGELEEAIEHYETAINQAKKIDNKKILALIFIEMGNIYSIKGETDIGVQYYKRSLPTLNVQKAYRELARAYNNIGDGYMKKGEWEMAIDNFDKCAEHAKRIGNKDFQGWSYFNKAEALIYNDEIHEARNYAKRAKEIMEKLNDSIGMASVYKVIGIADREERRFNESLDNFKEALGTIEGLELPFEKAEIKFGMGMVYEKMGQIDTAREYYNESKSILESIGAGQFIEKIDKQLKGLEEMV